MKHKRESERKGSSNPRNKINRFAANLREVGKAVPYESVDEFSPAGWQRQKIFQYFSYLNTSF